MKHLVPCPECSRHVRVSELQCPFCALPLDLANTPPPQLPRSRLSRAATFAFGATFVSATAISACGADDAPAPLYGAPPLEGAGAPGSSNGGSGGTAAEPGGGQFGVAGGLMGEGGLEPVYGGAPGEADAGMGGTLNLPGAAGASGEAGAGAAPDSSGGKGGGSAPVYGAPPGI